MTKKEFQVQRALGLINTIFDLLNLKLFTATQRENLIDYSMQLQEEGHTPAMWKKLMLDRIKDKLDD